MKLTASDINIDRLKEQARKKLFNDKCDIIKFLDDEIDKFTKGKTINEPFKSKGDKTWEEFFASKFSSKMIIELMSKILEDEKMLMECFDENEVVAMKRTVSRANTKYADGLDYDVEEDDNGLPITAVEMLELLDFDIIDIETYITWCIVEKLRSTVPQQLKTMLLKNIKKRNWGIDISFIGYLNLAYDKVKSNQVWKPKKKEYDDYINKLNSNSFFYQELDRLMSLKTDKN